MAKLQRQLSQEHFSAEGFGLVMDAYTSTCIDALINAFDLSQHKIVVDLGGGFGMLAESLADKYPKMKVTVFEQDHVIQMAKNLKPDFKINMIQGGQLFVVEKFLSEDKTGPENPVISSLFSAIMDLEGDYRTEQEYRGLLENAGFCSIQSKRIEGYNDHDVMLATKD